LKPIIPLRRFITEVTNEAPPDDEEAIRKALKSWHNRLYNGSIPRSVIAKIGRSLYVIVPEWEAWQDGRRSEGSEVRRGRPRASA
jgi:hypothetical protein